MDFSKMINNLKNINKDILKIMKCGLHFSFLICIIAATILCTYLFFYHSNFMFLLGFCTFKIGLIIAVEFIICGIAVDAIKNQGL